METDKGRESMDPLPYLLPIREAYEWKRQRAEGVLYLVILLPIREAYEWKQCVGLIHELTLQFF
ncbi:putative Similarity [Microcystis aeruginosa PCC 9807]|uniref:Putative Similarity n=1 Tax=Microcystis aeruginosa PCC 9807 TaxID=1160283 RepID=I4H2R8_MICAE|nr:putative Similarity [Microcystis aeruginosa PCC 9807]